MNKVTETTETSKFVELISPANMLLDTKHFQDMAPDRLTERRMEGRTDNAKTISLRLWRGIIRAIFETTMDLFMGSIPTVGEFYTSFPKTPRTGSAVEKHSFQ
ncbi:hypothetical protein DPMN_182688 [Dreissena polymorpha]|uniref:Uncharacterized protein n=1 Tax=Dreissena polymorpha TaxID=45954 RepID=A0A9D4DH00_DREPO|nr:hypothetical protein DPMN_182688 [Dreissena polymorpha]